MAVAVVIFVGGLSFQYVQGVLDMFLDYYAYVAVPLMVVGPLLLLMGARKSSYDDRREEGRDEK